MWLGMLGRISCLGKDPGPCKDFQHSPQILGKQQSPPPQIGVKEENSWVWIACAGGFY